ncbi:MAG: DCC1-like thiol-disulfide oxidoreductase family protein [Terracidiphilus sp.]
MNEIGDRLLVVFDGSCGFCNRSVRWFLHRDREDRLRFVASESPRVRGLLAWHGLGASGSEPGSERGPDTIVVVRDPDGPDERVFLRSDAVREMLTELPQPWPGAGVVLGWIPRPVRDAGYRVIARWRHRILGRLESCPIPTAAERARFL